MKKLIVVEKPSVGSEFKKALHVYGEKQDGFIENDAYIITWTIGHDVTLSYPDAYDEKYAKWNIADLPFLPDKYKLEVIPSMKKQFGIVKKMLNRKDIDAIYWAGDSAAEGSLIAYYVREVAGHNVSTKEYRVWIDSQTEEEILRGMREAKSWSSYTDHINSARMRSIEDYAFGINFSRALTIRYSKTLTAAVQSEKKVTIAVGRVMTCVLGMVVDKERSIRNFVPTTYYRPYVTFLGCDALWKLTEDSHFYGREASRIYNDVGLTKKQDAENMVANLNKCGRIVVVDKEKKTENKNAPLLFNLAELQGECSRRYKYSPDETLGIAQSLYEKKLTTYPRTDARVLSKAIAKEIKKNLDGLQKNYMEMASFVEKIFQNNWHTTLISKKRYVDDSKISDHYAIIPTGAGFENFRELKPKEKQVFELITRRFLAIFYPPAAYDKYSVEVAMAHEHFFATSRTRRKSGYLEIYGDADSDTDRNDSEDNKDGCITYEAYEKMQTGQQYEAAFSYKEHKTSAPKRYSSGSLILAMENAGQLIEDAELREQLKGNGVGTSATRAGILKKLVANSYLSLNKKTQIITPTLIGESIYEAVSLTIPDLLRPQMTANWGKGLSKIEAGEVSFEEYKKLTDAYITRYVDSIKKANHSAMLTEKITAVKPYYKKGTH